MPSKKTNIENLSGEFQLAFESKVAKIGWLSPKSVSKADEYLENIAKSWNEVSELGAVSHFFTEDEHFDGETIQINGKRLLQFGSCSYFGLELDPRLIEGAIAAVRKYGTQYSSSSVYVSVGLYRDLQEKYSRLFGMPAIIGQTTTLSHLSCLPNVVNDRDLILLDQQVHNSVQLASRLVQERGVPARFVPHNSTYALEQYLKKYSSKYQKIWFLIDGIYSMYGDVAPISELEMLMDKYPALHLYIDDAHGMSWNGLYGRGYALSKLTKLDRSVLVTSHAKCFGSAGGTILIQDPDLHARVKKFGATLMFSGPIQPAVLGASNVSADIHLSNEISTLQVALKQKMKFRNDLISKYEIPVKSEGGSPITFVCIGDHSDTGRLFHFLKDRGFYVNVAVFPAVSRNKSGIRFTTTLLQSNEHTESLLKSIGDFLDQNDAQISRKMIERKFFGKGKLYT